MTEVICPGKSCGHPRSAHDRNGCTGQDPDGSNTCGCKVTYMQLGPARVSLTTKQVEEMTGLYWTGASLRELAERFGVSRETVRRMVRRMSE